MKDIQEIKRLMNQVEARLKKASADMERLHAIATEVMRKHGEAAGLSRDEVESVVAPKEPK